MIEINAEEFLCKIKYVLKYLRHLEIRRIAIDFLDYFLNRRRTVENLMSKDEPKI